MLYEVITKRNCGTFHRADFLGEPAIDGGLDGNGNSAQEHENVITSYSIHYTKLYEYGYIPI